MIDKKSTGKEWIETISAQFKVDKVLVEKVIHALILLEGLAESDLNFVFKGGTALMLMLNSTKRLSIDIDIIMPIKSKELDSVLAKICTEKGFIRYEKKERNTNHRINIEHNKFFYHSVIQDREDSVLLDILFEENKYQKLLESGIESPFIAQIGNILKVTVPDFNNILGDKLTAFAPNTTGIPYFKKNREMGQEILKQLFDIGCLFDEIDNLQVVSDVFQKIAVTELAYRDNIHTVNDILDDILDTSQSLCLRQNIGNGNFTVLSTGIMQVKPFIFTQTFHLEKSFIFAAKAAYLASLIKYQQTVFERYDENINMTQWQISALLNTKLNKLKKTDEETFFYWYKTFEIINNHA